MHMVYKLKKPTVSNRTLLKLPAQQSCGISGFHSSGYEEYYLL
jgi:hypothetical protein